MHEVDKAYPCLQPGLLLSPAPTCCTSQDLMCVSGFSDAGEKQPMHACNRTLRQTSPFLALYVSKGLSFFFSPSTASFTSYSFGPQMLCVPKRPLLFQLRMLLLKPGLATSMWKPGQKDFTSRFPHGIERCPSATPLCLSFFTW